jgi:polysaccharide deacetylase 2 family uncharacterized protein YibQ
MRTAFRFPLTMILLVVLCILIPGQGAVSQNAQTITSTSSTTPTPSPTPKPSLWDLPETWAETSIRTLYNHQIINGFPDGSFRPEEGLTRAQIAKMLVLWRGLSLVSNGTLYFSDVPADHWANSFIATAVGQGFVNGFPDGSYRPEDPVTKAQLLKLLVAAKQWTALLPLSTLLTFPDTAGHWVFAHGWLEAALQQGVLKTLAMGEDPHMLNGANFTPDAPITRAQTCVLLDRCSGIPDGTGTATPIPTPSATEPTAPSLTPTITASGVEIAIIIDDIGYNYGREIQTLIASPYAITLAILPEVEYGSQIAEDAVAEGKEVIMHLPMEKALDMPGTIYTWMGEQQIRDLLTADINDVPGAVGINNHMGVAGTSDPSTMRTVMSFVRERGLFFVDSLVTSSSVVSQMAAEQGMPVLVRDVFLDGENSHEYIRGQLQRLRDMALRKGFAIGIGHIRSEGIADLIGEAATAWVAEGIELVPVSHLLRFVGG